ncbi:hypothetical protein NUW58_g6474 [Xylaria curta]|uniref:Uncharacterized protein n=1 Tax=Xylaria curta TaxID=42375 RepID=A0ACC1NUQ8_9PEZI|nr:hypothetical protein NUW58_g6474 [Xylaria curta]
MEEQPDVEILIHIGAPSRAVDDARYRSLAGAYIAYQPAETVHFYAQSSHESSTRSQDSWHMPAIDDGESSIMLVDDRIGVFQSLQASFGSVVDNADSPRIRTHGMSNHAIPQQTPTSATRASWKTPPSTVQDSHPINHNDFASLTTPTRVLENYLQHFEPPSGSSRQDSQSTRFDASHERISQSESCQFSPKNPVPCTQQLIPCTPYIRVAEPPLDRREESEYKSNRWPQPQQPGTTVIAASDDNVIEETTFLLSSSQPSAHARADSEPPPKLRRLDLVTSPHGLARASSDIGPQSLPGHQAPVTVKFLSNHEFTYESLEIRPPEPPTSEPHIEPQDLITRGLRSLGHDVDIPSRFRPKEQTRELRPYERGHWLVDCSSWGPRLKHDAWAFLANYVGTGIAGWGVWCKRDPDFKELRAYCWGSVAAHIYYVLWLSSQRKIVFTGSSWIDAEGARVIVMSSRDLSRR